MTRETTLSPRVPALARMSERMARILRDALVPLLGGATLCVMLPLKVQGRPVVLGMGGALERIRAHRDDYLQLMQDLVKTLQP